MIKYQLQWPDGRVTTIASDAPIYAGDHIRLGPVSLGVTMVRHVGVVQGNGSQITTSPMLITRSLR